MMIIIVVAFNKKEETEEMRWLLLMNAGSNASRIIRQQQQEPYNDSFSFRALVYVCLTSFMVETEKESGTVHRLDHARISRACIGTSKQPGHKK